MKTTYATILLMLGASGCNLVFDIDSFPYEGAGVVDMGVDIQEDMPTADMPKDLPEPVEDMEPIEDMAPPEDMEPDLPSGPPELVITEIMINTGPQANGGEIGEYLEVKNVGVSPIDPRAISLVLHNEMGRSGTVVISQPSSDEQLAIFNGLQDIQPGSYFVFARFEIPELPLLEIMGAGNYFDFGTWGNLISFANSGERRIEVQYFSPEGFQILDSVRWVSSELRPTDPELESPGLEIVEDISLGVRPGFEDVDSNDNPENWCLESAPVAGPDSFLGSPGKPSLCQ